jgi:hypothetical protein
MQTRSLEPNQHKAQAEQKSGGMFEHRSGRGTHSKYSGGR